MELQSTNGTQRWSLPREISPFPFQGVKDIKHKQQKPPEHHKNCPVPTNRKTKGLNMSKALHNSEQHFYFQCRQQIPFGVVLFLAGSFNLEPLLMTDH